MAVDNCSPKKRQYKTNNGCTLPFIVSRSVKIKAYLEDIICIRIQSLNRLANRPLVSVIGTETVVSGNPGVWAEGAGGKYVHFASPDAGILLAPSRKERVQLKVERTSQILISL